MEIKMDIIIEKATASDAGAVLEYLKKIGGETDNLSFGAQGLPFSVEDEQAYIAGMENSKDSILLLAKENGKIIGDASLSRLPRRMSHRGELGVSVLKEYWNRGVGGKLIKGILDFARENSFEIIDLEVRSDNEGAIHLYEKFGFQKIGTHKSYMKIGSEYVPADYMCLKLD